jgi:hypothetical protein
MLLSWPAIVIPSTGLGDHAHPSQIDEEFRRLDEQSVGVARGGTHAVTIR